VLILIWRQIRHRPGRSVALAAGIIVAATSFSLLTAAATTGTADVQHTVAHNFRGAYDILVRPANSTTELERTSDLVQQNYLSGIFGGITSSQLRHVRDIPGVTVAAPIAMVGYVLPFVKVPIDLRPYLAHGSRQVFRAVPTWTADNGLSHYRDAPAFVYVTRNRFALPKDAFSYYEQLRPGAPAVPTCSHFYDQLLPGGTFAARARTYLNCYSITAGGKVRNRRLNDPPLAPDEVGLTVAWGFPFLLAAVDPRSEAELAGVNSAVVSGRYLRENDRPRVASTSSGTGFHEIPVIAASRPYIDDSLSIDVQRLVPRGGVTSLLLSHDPFAALARAPGRTVTRVHVGPSKPYDELLSPPKPGQPPQVVDAYWTAGPNDYRTVGRAAVTAIAHPNPDDVWSSRFSLSVNPPMDNDDTNFRPLAEHVGSNEISGSVLASVGLNVVGRFNPAKIPGFNPLTRVPLTTYNAPTAVGADLQSRQLLGNAALSPTANIAGYIQSPPLLLTSLRALPALLNPNVYTDTNQAAPISVIRVRVGGLHGTVRQQLAEIGQVALAIKKSTHLQVDVTAGASPTQVEVRLPAGKYGRPALNLLEPWVQKGVAVRILSAVDRKSAALFGLILLITAFFLANGAFASVRSRRTEIGVLRCLGWRRSAIVRLVLGELIMIGLAAGLTGAVLAAILIKVFGLDLAPWHVGLVPPVAVALATIAGLVPAWRAGRGQPLDAVAPPVQQPRRSRPVRTLAGLAMSNLRRMPARVALAAASLGIGVAALTVLVTIQLSFGHTIAGTALGGFVTTQVRGVDYLSAALAILLGAASVADVLYLNIRERQPEFAALAATGWQTRHVARVAWVDGAGIGLLGSAAGAALGVGVAVGLSGPVSAAGKAAAIAAVVGLAIVTATSRVLVLSLRRLEITTALADA
jgi:putative ABC transport system permease protein